MQNEDVRRKQSDTTSILARDLLKELSFPLENIMAYTRFYKNHTQADTQHWKDLMEIMEQAVRIREVMNRVEARLVAEGDSSGSEEGNKLFRKSQRRMELIPVVLRGTDLLGEAFETPSYTLNISAAGACLLLSDGLVAVGQSVGLESREFSLTGIVRWVVPGKTRDMMLIGIEFVTAKAQEFTPPSQEDIAAIESNGFDELPVAAASSR